ncbi:response regulator [Pelosinus baikalensis]|uniref:Transcriptional regulatory protein n=1 Tax=Pelosinus baikalensis TaxID=2892015 RepID=A0ABS8HR89_9FIRM|nr:response regulator [Pelosinus baikalensis]MCC5465697.1 response regulator [Pelosinus baikalensis]
MKKIKVLIVEDDPMVAEINKNYTEAVEGFCVNCVTKNGKDALEKINTMNIDLVILDIYLPEINGVDLLSLIRREDKNIDVIMITAADDSDTVSRVLRQGVIAYITKPFKFDRYRFILENYRRQKQTILQKTNLEQSDIDNMLAVAVHNEKKVMPKNLHTQTLTMITNYLLACKEPISAEELSSGVGISRVTCRRYLEYLVDKGQLQMDLSYISVGRPIHRFTLVSPDINL